MSRFKPPSCFVHDPRWHEAWSEFLTRILDMVVANQESHLVSGAFEKTMNAFSGHPIVEAEESNAALQSRSNQKMVFLVMLLQVKILGNLLLFMCSRTIVKKGTRTITDSCHHGRNTRRGRGAHRHQSQRHQPPTLARR